MNVKQYFKIVLLAVIICVLIVIGFMTASRYNKTVSTATVKTTSNGDINILFMATDKGGLLTDTIMLASLSESSQMINILSIPRDTKIHINGGTYKINSAYGMSKEECRVDLPISIISELTGLDVNYYAVVSPEVVVDIVDTLGGVDFNVPQRMYYVDPTQNLVIDLQPGQQLLDGDKAEQFLRYRSGYTNADLGRISAQQEFIKELFRQKFKAKYILKAGAIFNSVKENVDTNISITDVNTFIDVIRNFEDYTINTYQLPGEAGSSNNISYFNYNPDETEELVQSVFLNHENEEKVEEE